MNNLSKPFVRRGCVETVGWECDMLASTKTCSCMALVLNDKGAGLRSVHGLVDHGG